MKCRAIILAAGTADLWKNHLKVPKHLIPINGEPLIHRTTRLLYEHGIDDIYVVCQDDRAEKYLSLPAKQGIPQIINRGWVQEQEQSRYLWNTDGKTIILYGDTFYSEKLIHEISINTADDWHIYARHGASKYTGKDHGEMWAWVFNNNHHTIIDSARNVAISYMENGLWNRCLGWEVYRIMMKQVPWHHYKDDIHFIDWDDESEDFDGPTDWINWSKNLPHLLKKEK